MSTGQFHKKKTFFVITTNTCIPQTKPRPSQGAVDDPRALRDNEPLTLTYLYGQSAVGDTSAQNILDADSSVIETESSETGSSLTAEEAALKAKGRFITDEDTYHFGDTANLGVELDADAKPKAFGAAADTGGLVFMYDQLDWNDVVKNTTPELLSDHKNRFNRIKMFKKAGAHDELKKAAKAKKKIVGRQKLAKKVHGGIQVVDPVAKDKYGDLEQNVTLNVAPFERRAKMANGLLENCVRYCWCVVLRR